MVHNSSRLLAKSEISKCTLRPLDILMRFIGYMGGGCRFAVNYEKIRKGGAKFVWEAAHIFCDKNG